MRSDLIVGIDGSLTSTGWVVLDGDEDNVIEYGIIKTYPYQTFNQRFETICEEMEKLLGRYPTIKYAAVEKTFVGGHKNIASAASLYEAIGVMMGVIKTKRPDIRITRYFPQTWKSEVIGNSKADKRTIKKVMKARYGDLGKVQDAYDAAGIACKLASDMRFGDVDENGELFYDEE